MLVYPTSSITNKCKLDIMFETRRLMNKYSKWKPILMWFQLRKVRNIVIVLPGNTFESPLDQTNEINKFTQYK